MTETREGLLEHYRKGRALILAAIDGLSDAELTDPSLDGWSVKDHLAHIAYWDEVRAEEVRRMSAGHQSAWKMTDAQDDAYNATGYELRKGLSLEQVRWEFETSRDRLNAVIAAAPPEALDISLYGAAGVRSDHEQEHAGWIRQWRSGNKA